MTRHLLKGLVLWMNNLEGWFFRIIKNLAIVKPSFWSSAFCDKLNMKLEIIVTGQHQLAPEFQFLTLKLDLPKSAKFWLPITFCLNLPATQNSHT